MISKLDVILALITQIHPLRQKQAVNIGVQVRRRAVPTSSSATTLAVSRPAMSVTETMTVEICPMSRTVAVLQYVSIPELTSCYWLVHRDRHPENRAQLSPHHTHWLVGYCHLNWTVPVIWFITIYYLLFVSSYVTWRHIWRHLGASVIW